MGFHGGLNESISDPVPPGSTIDGLHEPISDMMQDTWLALIHSA